MWRPSRPQPSRRAVSSAVQPVRLFAGPEPMVLPLSCSILVIGESFLTMIEMFIGAPNIAATVISGEPLAIDAISGPEPSAMSS
jgi:hypothetical protein